MRDLANILRVNKLTPIEGKDRIELATIENWEVIVKKNEFKVGDLCVYIEYDTILPERPEFEFLRKSCYSPKYNGFRIRNMKMAGVFSQGIVFPLSILPPENKVGSVYKEGLAVADLLGIKRYDPEELVENISSKKQSKLHKKLMKIKLYRYLWKKFHNKESKGYPENIKESDETNIQKVFNKLKSERPNELYYKTEKLEGQAATFCLKNKRIFGNFYKREYTIYSHKQKRKVGDNSNWDKVSQKYNIEEILRNLSKNYTLQGEICGPGIQKNIYHLSELQLFLYSVIDSETGKMLSFRDIPYDFIKADLSFVPLLSINNKLPETLKEVIEESNGESVLAEVRREGIVWRSMTDPNISFKAKSPDYAIWFEGK